MTHNHVLAKKDSNTNNRGVCVMQLSFMQIHTEPPPTHTHTQINYTKIQLIKKTKTNQNVKLKHQ